MTCNLVVRTLLYLAGTSRKVAARMTAPPRGVDNLAPARRALSGRAAMCCRAPTLTPEVNAYMVAVAASDCQYS